MDNWNKFKQSLVAISTKDIATNYNDGRIIGAKDLPILAQIYKENNKTIIVMLTKKPTKPNDKMPAWFKKWSQEVYETQPPKWFKDFEKKQEKFNKTILIRLDNLETRLDNLETRLDNLVAKNHLVE